MPFKRWRRPAALAIFLALATGPAFSQSDNILLDCTSCHSLSSEASPAYPVLNGQPVLYLIEQLDAYRTGNRAHQQMQRSALALREGGAPAMARMYADAPAPELTLMGDRPEFETAMKLDAEGAWERGIPPCSSCHVSPTAERTNIDPGAHASPRIHGQSEAYLAGILRAYASGERETGGLRRMQAYAERLTDEEIAALASYLAAFKPVEQNQ
ncbi:c-type cytochrome [Roseovarius aquimarinus]|uniref:C-type cytochrome n=1 Tax=Roseovarius aquimarinus TaxID=1229156 RepID=A0ABW7I4H7_9RHOB